MTEIIKMEMVVQLIVSSKMDGIAALTPKTDLFVN